MCLHQLGHHSFVCILGDVLDVGLEFLRVHIAVVGQIEHTYDQVLLLVGDLCDPSLVAFGRRKPL